MKILIVDDEPLARDDLHYLIEDTNQAELIVEAGSIDEALVEMKKQVFDVIFLDIQLGETSGFTLAQHLKTQKIPTQIIFSTAYEQYALDAFNIDAVDYILKPFDQNRIEEALQKARRRIKINVQEDDEAHSFPQKISVSHDGKTYLIDPKNILYLEAQMGKLFIHTLTDQFQAKRTLTAFKKLLDPTSFIQVHRSYIVNINCIKTVEPGFNHNYLITLTNHDKIPIARSYVKNVRNQLGF